MHSLFSYGTLQMEELLELFFGLKFKDKHCFENFKLLNNRLYTNGSYFYVQKEKGFHVDGMLLKLNDEQLELVDLWEEVPTYFREKVNIMDGANNNTDAWCYYHTQPIGYPVSAEIFSSKTKETVLKAAHEMLSALK